MKKLKSIKQKFKNFSFKKTTAIFTTICFVLSIVFSQTAYAVMPAPVNVPVTPDSDTISKSLIPFNLGRITDAYYSNSGDIVINIQDLHSHEQTQRNISSILSILDSKFGLEDIYLEGATGTINTQWLANIKDISVKQKVLNNLLESGRLTGGEYFAVKANKNTILKGLEDKSLYSENFKILGNMYDKEIEIKNYISVLNTLFDKKSKHYFSNENKKINKIIENYKQGKIKTDKYIELLLKKAQQTDMNLSKYKSIINFAGIISKQKSFNSKKLSGEIKGLLKEIKDKISFQEYKTLTENATKKEYEVEFYFNLLKKAQDLNILNDKKYKNTNLFFEYLILNQNINTIDLANDEKLFVQELKNNFATTQAEKDIYFLQQNLENLSHYLTNKMTAKDYEVFSENKTNFELLWGKYIDIDNLTSLTEYLDVADRFYENNVERNRVFIKNLFGKKVNNTVDGLRIKNASIDHKEKIMEELAKGKKIHIVITGGFHTYGFNKLLEDENINYIVITPNITEETTNAENLYKNVFGEQYNIMNTTFANRPVTEVVAILNKGEIKDVRPIGTGVEIEYTSGETLSLNKLSQKQGTSEVLTPEQAQIAADIILDIQEFKKAKRENLRAQQEGTDTIPTDEIEKRILEGFSKLDDLSLKMAFGEKIRTEVWARPLTTTGLKNTWWYKALTRFGWITLRESFVAISEQKDFDNIFKEEILERINKATESSREQFLQEHEYYNEKEDVTIKLNDAVSSVIYAMNVVYEQVLGLTGIHFIAGLAANIAGAKKHIQYNKDLYEQAQKLEYLLTKSEQHVYEVEFSVYLSSPVQISYKTKIETTAPSKAKAFNNAVRNTAVAILEKAGLDKSLLRLTMYNIRQYLNSRGKNENNTVKEIIPEEEKTDSQEEKETILSKTTNKKFYMRQRKNGEYTFHIVIEGLNSSPELAAFQTVHARSPKQAVREVVYHMCTATQNGFLTGGKFNGIVISPENFDTIKEMISKDMSKIDVAPNMAPIFDNTISQKKKKQSFIGKKKYRVVIKGFNDIPTKDFNGTPETNSDVVSEWKARYQYVFATGADDAKEQAVDAIITAKGNNELIGGYYNYVAINKDNEADILSKVRDSKDVTISKNVTVKEVPYEGLSSARAFKGLTEYIKKIMTIKELFSQDKGKPKAKQRKTLFSRILNIGNNQTLLFNFSNTNLDEEILDYFSELFAEAQFEQKRNDMLSGKIYNRTEQRAVLHTALRNIELDENGNLKAKSSIYVKGKDIMPDVIRVLNQMKSFSDKIISKQWVGATGKPITDIVSIGIGGSDLGPRMATEALSTFKKGPNVHFVSNVDPNDIDSKIRSLGLNPETTLFIIESKTFTTQETMSNANLAKKWITDNLGKSKDVISKHFVAVSTNKEEISKFGIDSDNMFEFWDWVGGRFSVWSAVGLPLMCSIGFDNFVEFLSGANEIDENFKNNDIRQNIPALMAILNILERNFLNRSTYCITPYNNYLRLFTDHIKQLYMESLGKSVDIEGNKIVDYNTASTIFGGVGTDAQHSFFQLLHQGTEISPIDIIGFVLPSDNITDKKMLESQNMLLANIAAQATAMAFGRTYEETVAKLIEEGADETTAREEAKAKTFDGNRPSTTIMFDKLTPRSLGASIALYEDMVAALGILWNINAFDQEGVKLGKEEAKEKLKKLSEKKYKGDSTLEYIGMVLKKAADLLTGSQAKTTQQGTQTNLQDLISQLTDSKNDTELKDAIEKMSNAGFKESYIKELLFQYLSLRNGNVPDTIYSKTKPIKFGTAGVRGIMGEEVDFLDIVIITQAISNVISSIASRQNISTKDIKVLVGGDSRFLSKQFAEIVSKVLAANDINVVISSDDIPSPAISYYTRANKFTLSINITASHNPKEHNGYKITLGDGGQADTKVTTMIEDEIKRLQNELTSNVNPVKVVKDSERIQPVDVKPKFIEDFITMIRNIFAIDKASSFNRFKEKAAKWTVVVDPKNGATKNYYYEILKFFGFNVVMINDNFDPTFGGQKPEPSFANTEQLRKKVPEVKQTMPGQNILGISTDVDGDRFAVVDEEGNFITANDIGTILLNFRLKTLLDDLLSQIMAATGDIEKQNAILKNFVIKKDRNGNESDRKIIIPRNCATTHVLDDLAENLVSQCYDKLKELNLDPQLLNKFKNNTVEVKEVNVGFKYFAKAKHDAENEGDLFLLGVESSGGISVAEWIYDKCGFLANLMLLFVLVENNKQPGDILGTNNRNNTNDNIYTQIGYTPQGLETAIKFREIVEKEGKLNTPEQISAEAKKRQEHLMATLQKLKENENNEDIKNLFVNIDAGLKIKEIRTNDGIKIIFENGAWLLIRPSGTEPIVRIFDEAKIKEGDEDFSQKLADFVMENGGKKLTDAIEEALKPKTIETTPSAINTDLFKNIITGSIETLQRLIYSILFKDNLEYTIVANANDLARIEKAKELSKSGIKVNLILLGETTLTRETDSRISTDSGDLAFCLIDTPNKNLTVYGYDDRTHGQTVNVSAIDEQSALIAMLKNINGNSDRKIKILDLPKSLSTNIVTADVENSIKGMFSTIGIGKTVFNLFSDALKSKLTPSDDMVLKPSLVASNLSADRIDNFSKEDISKLADQGVTTIIISADDKLLKDKSQTLKDLVQNAHNSGLKVMFNYSFDLKNMSIKEFEMWITSFNDRFQQFKENGGINGLQVDLSQNGTLANSNDVLHLLSKLSETIINEQQNIDSFLSIKMPSDVYSGEFLTLCNNKGIKLVTDYDSPLFSTGLANLKTENMIINISADKNGFISIPKLSAIFEDKKNVVSMISLDLPILESMGTSKDGFFAREKISIAEFIYSIFEATPEGQKIKGINDGRNFVKKRDSVIDEDTMRSLYEMYLNDDFNISKITAMLQTTLRENMSKYELTGYVQGLLQATELKMINATDISFEKKEYTNLLMQTLLDFRINKNKIGEKENYGELIISDDIEKVLDTGMFRAEFQPQIAKIHNILNGSFEGKIDAVINILSSLKDNPELNSRERNMVLEGLLSLLLGFAKQDTIDVSGFKGESIANIKAILSAA